MTERSDYNRTSSGQYLSGSAARELMNRVVGVHEDAPLGTTDHCVEMEPPTPVPMTRTVATAPQGLEERWNWAMGYEPDLRPEVLVKVRTSVVEAVMATPFTSRRADSSRLSHMYAFATFVLNRKGSFDPSSDLTERMIREFVIERKRDGYAQGTLGTSQSTLRMIRTGASPLDRSWKPGRPVAQRPYTPKEWGALSKAVNRLTDDDLRSDVQMLLDLCGGVGMRSDEAHAATGQWLQFHEGEAVVCIPKSTGEFRLVPVFGGVASRLAQHHGRDAYLLSPGTRDRRNVISRLTKRAGRFPGLQELSARRARNFWVADLVAAAVPTAVVYDLSGSNPASHTIGDIVRSLPRVEIEEAISHLKRAQGV